MWLRNKFWVITFGFVLTMLALGAYISVVTIKINQNLKFADGIKKVQFFTDVYLIELGNWTETAYSDIEFIQNGNNENLQKAISSLDSAKSVLTAFGSKWVKKHPEHFDEISFMNVLLDSSLSLTEEMSFLIRQKGFKNFGLEGEMRETIHQLEKHPENPSLISLLTLRRHEKDFLLRKDKEYVEKFNNAISEYKTLIRNEVLEESSQEALIKLLVKYTDYFNEIVTIEEKIGFYSYNGLRGKIKNHHFEYKEKLSYINNHVEQRIKTLGKHSDLLVYVLVFMFTVMLLALLVAFYYFNKYVSKPILELENTANQIANGKMSVVLDATNSSMIIKDVMMAFNRIISKIKETVSNIEKIVNRELIDDIELSNEEDEIGISLNKIIHRLNEIDDAENKRSWETIGMNKFLEIMRNHEDKKSLCDSLLPELTRYINANVSAIFLQSDEMETSLEMVACYAYDRKKHLNKAISHGEGVTGQAFLEKESIYLTELPKDFISIKSGTGECIPNAALACPLMNNEKCLGVIELASVRTLEAHEIRFVEKVANAMAATIFSLDLRNNSKGESSRIKNF